MQPPAEAEETEVTEDSEDSFFRQLTALSSNRLGGNPFYSQEEFTYNQVNIYIYIISYALYLYLSTPRTPS